MEKDKQETFEKEIDENPESFLPSFNPFQIFLSYLDSYGWWIIGIAIIGIWLYNKTKPSIEKWKIAKEDAEYHKNPDIALSRMEAIEAARAKQQKILDESARDRLIKEQEKQEKKRQEFIDKNSGKSGNKLGSRIDYFPLSGPGTSGGYKPPKKSKCSGGGCGK